MGASLSVSPKEERVKTTGSDSECCRRVIQRQTETDYPVSRAAANINQWLQSSGQTDIAIHPCGWGDAHNHALGSQEPLQIQLNGTIVWSKVICCH